MKGKKKMPTVDTNKKENKNLRDFLGEHNAKPYTNMIVNAPADDKKGASFQVGDSFRTPTYVAGAKDKYLNPVDIEKTPMDYVAAFAKNEIEKLHVVSKVLDPNGDKNLVQPKHDAETGELTSYYSVLSGSVTLKGADGENYRLNIQEKGMGKDTVAYVPSKTETEIYGKDGNPSRPAKVQIIGAEISVAKQDKETKEYSQEMGKLMLWGRMNPRKGSLVPVETEREGAIVNNYFSIGNSSDTKMVRFVAQLVKDGFSYTKEQLAVEKNDPEMKTEPNNMTFRIMDKGVANNIKNSFVKVADEVTQGTSRNIPNMNDKGMETGKSMFINVTLDTASTMNEEGKKVSKTTTILTPATWTSKKHEIDYTQHIAKVEPQYGQKDLKELGENLNKAVEAYAATKAKEIENTNPSVSAVKTKTKTKTKTKEKELEA